MSLYNTSADIQALADAIIAALAGYDGATTISVQGISGGEPLVVSFSSEIPLATDGLTNTELRAADVKVTLDSEIVAVSGPLTDDELRENPVPVSVGSSALPTGAATEATLSTMNGKITSCNTGAVTVSASALPTGAATAAKQPSIGTAGSSSADVISVQGITSGTALPVSGTVSLSTTDNTVLDNIDTSTTDIKNVIGTDGSAGPSKTISVGGTDSDGAIQEVLVDSDGHLQVEVTTNSLTADDIATALDALVIDADNITLSSPAAGTYIGNVIVPFDIHMLVPNGTEADQALAVDNTSGGVQFAAFHADTTHVFVECQSADVRYTLDNSAPTSTNGHIMVSGQSGVWNKTLASATKFIRSGDSNAVIHASQLKSA